MEIEDADGELWYVTNVWEHGAWTCLTLLSEAGQMGGTRILDRTVPIRK